MDLLARRYASPFFVLDEMIRQNRLSEFVFEVNQIHYEEEQDKMLWDVWLHKVFDKGFGEWKRSIQTKVEATTTSESELEATVTNSKELLNGFNPE